MDKNEIYSQILENSKPTVARWRKEKRAIIELLDNYFSLEEIQEFIDSRKIIRLDNMFFPLNTISELINIFVGYVCICENDEDYEILHILCRNAGVINIHQLYTFDYLKFISFLNHLQNDLVFKNFVMDFNFSKFNKLLHYKVEQFPPNDDFITSPFYYSSETIYIKINKFLSKVDNFDEKLYSFDPKDLL
ncbi:MAG: hypothetical protein PHD79_10295 [Aliarcobacter sp.]|nr:hypothetical protein [Aliarcobacter sp.]